MPASTSSDSALRRMRVARWSSRNRLSSASGFSSVRSSWSMKDSWREQQHLVAAGHVDEHAAIEPRRAACSWATTVVALTSLNAAASRPTSSSDVTGISGSWQSGPSPGVAIRSTIFGSSSRIWAAASVRRRSGTGDGAGDDQGEDDRHEDGEQGEDEDLQRVLWRRLRARRPGCRPRRYQGLETTAERRDVVISRSPAVDADAVDDAVGLVDRALAGQLVGVAGRWRADTGCLTDPGRVLTDKVGTDGGVLRRREFARE